MIKIALLCENGASTGMLVRKMLQSAEESGTDVEIKAYPFTQLENFVDNYDVVLFAPQLVYKLDKAKGMFPNQEGKFAPIPAMDFGMMNGQKVLSDAINLVNQ